MFQLSPNVDETNDGSGRMGGFKEVSVSSFSSNIDGKTQQEAKTYINDNGKVTAYTVQCTILSYFTVISVLFDLLLFWPNGF